MNSLARSIALGGAGQSLHLPLPSTGNPSSVDDEDDEAAGLDAVRARFFAGGDDADDAAGGDADRLAIEIVEVHRALRSDMCETA